MTAVSKAAFHRARVSASSQSKGPALGLRTAARPAKALREHLRDGTFRAELPLALGAR